MPMTGGISLSIIELYNNEGYYVVAIKIAEVVGLNEEDTRQFGTYHQIFTSFYNRWLQFTL